ncbi:putative HD phosphohydrolase [Streptomyces aurantiacus]|uniref:hypothetical protein n=1 Tax=Streptomyces aurantiacus TaxID=47760 RepID=UPI00278F3353|nr:hypothetical protein [Streptomyces aurantiacus]MDQ0772666.1 putative HD phosphohydrolase [Streptomyces aurantiacus]
MELRSVEELMDLLHACRGARGTACAGGAPVDLHDHALQTAALLRRSRPADKELQVAGLVHVIGQLSRPGDLAGRADHAAGAVRPLLGERVSLLVRLHREDRVREPAVHRPVMDEPVIDDVMDDALILRQADESARTAGLDAGVLEDWRTVLELVSARHTRLGAP